MGSREFGDLTGREIDCVADEFGGDQAQGGHDDGVVRVRPALQPGERFPSVRPERSRSLLGPGAGGCVSGRGRGTVAGLDRVAGEVLDGLDTEDLPDKAIYGRCGDCRVSLGPAPGSWDGVARKSRHPAWVWIGSADDEGPHEADIEQAIDEAACGAEAEHANASGRGPGVHLALSGVTAAVRGDLDVAAVQRVWDMDRVTSLGQVGDRDLLRGAGELVERVRGIRGGGAGLVGPGV